MNELFTDFAHIVRSGLIYVIVKPVGIKKLSRRAPVYDRLLGRIVVREIVAGDIGIHSLGEVSVILIGKGVGIVFRMKSHKELQDREYSQSSLSQYPSLLNEAHRTHHQSL